MVAEQVISLGVGRDKYSVGDVCEHARFDKSLKPDRLRSGASIKKQRW